jgi:AraC-like DNA-binding protein
MGKTIIKRKPHEKERQYITRAINFYAKMFLPLVIEEDAQERPFPIKISNRFRILLIEEGTGVILSHNLKTTIIPPMVVILNEKDRFQLANMHGIKYHILSFHPDVVNSDFSFINLRDPNYRENISLSCKMDRTVVVPFLKENLSERLFYINHISTKQIKDGFRDIKMELEEQKIKMWPCIARGIFIQLLFFINSLIREPKIIQQPPFKQTKSDPNDKKEKLIEDVILYLNLNYKEEISIPDLARQFVTNRTSLGNLFKEKMGMSIVFYLTKLRVEIAASLLHNTQLDIFEIMEKVGFHDKSHFGRAFKKYFGNAPSLYRKKNSAMLY